MIIIIKKIKKKQFTMMELRNSERWEMRFMGDENEDERLRENKKYRKNNENNKNNRRNENNGGESSVGEINCEGEVRVLM